MSNLPLPYALAMGRACLPVCLLLASGCSKGRTAAAPASLHTPKYGPVAIPLSRSHDYFRQAPAPDYWALAPYYVPQHNDRACSLATLSMLVNAARSSLPLGQNQQLVTQPLLESSVANPMWSQALAPGGEGVTLDQLAGLSTQSLAAFGLRAQDVEVTHVRDASPDALAKLRERLLANEASSDDWLLLNFYVDTFVGVGDYGHIAPVGAYDAERRLVLVMDPDRTWYEPYWVPDEVALRGMATLDAASGDYRGYLHVSASR